MPVPGVGVHGGDHPVLARPAARSGTPRPSPAAPGPGPAPWPAAPPPAATASASSRPSSTASTAYPSRARESISCLAGGRVVPVDLRLAQRGVVVAAGQHRPQLRAPGPRRRPRAAPRTAERINVTVSIVATASYSGVESSTRRRPDQPGRARRLQPHLEDPVRSRRAAQPRAHVHQHRVRETAPSRRRRTRRHRPRTATARRRRTARPPPGPTAPPAAAAPSPWPPPTAARSAGPAR